MSGGPGERSGDAGTRDVAPVDFDRLELVRDRLRGDDRFVDIAWRPEFAPDRLVCEYDPVFYPGRVEEARLEIVWFENGDFSIQYHERHETGTFDHRWDRHPSDHNAREHVHPGPDAPTPGADTSHPRDWRDVLSGILSEVQARQRAFWSTEG